MEQFNNLRQLDKYAEIEYMINYVHSKVTETDCIGIMKKENGEVNYHSCMSSFKAIDKIFKFIDENNTKDLYMTLNTFWKFKRTYEHLRYMNALYVDIDYYNLNLSKQDVINEIDCLVENNIIPKPTMLIDSGKGMYAIFKIKPVPSMGVTLWSALQKYLCKKLEHIGSDFACTDPTRVLRLPGTINSKTNKRAKIMSVNDIVYDIHDLKKLYLPNISELIEEQKKKKSKIQKSKVTFLFNGHTLNLARIKDIEKLCEMRNYDITNRELTLFVYRNCCEQIYGKDIAINKMLQLHAKFKNKLGSDNRIICDTNSVSEKIKENKAYKLPNEKIIEYLKITPEEQEHMTTIINNRVKQVRSNEKRKQLRRNENGLLKKEQEKLELALLIMQEIKKNPCIKQKEIANILNISTSKVCRILKDIETGTIELPNIIDIKEQNIVVISKKYNKFQKMASCIDEVCTLFFRKTKKEPLLNIEDSS